ncbi:MAG: hypothetical protein II826_10090 [Prevotella sp.]|nr:hypothetical protein [Prevotella sp.]
MKEYLAEIALCTIVAAVATLLFCVIGLDKSWQEASTTFGTCFLVMFVLGLWKRLKNNQQN